MQGYFERERQAHRGRAWLATTTGTLAQVQPKHHPSVAKLIGEKAAVPLAMNDDQILGVMKAWARVTNRGGGEHPPS